MSLLMSNLREDKDNEMNEDINIDEKKNKVNRELIIKKKIINVFSNNMNMNDNVQQFIRNIIINKKKRRIIFLTKSNNENDKLKSDSPLGKININSFMRILKFLSSKEKEKENKNIIGINHYENFIISIINYFNNLKSKVTTDMEKNNNNNISNSNINDKKEESEINKNKKELELLIKTFIRKIIYIKKLYIYIIIKKHYCTDKEEKTKIIEEGSKRVEIAKNELENIYKNILIILKKSFKGNNELIIKYLTLIILRLKEKQKINDDDIKEAKLLFKKDKIKFEKMKEEDNIEENEEFAENELLLKEKKDDEKNKMKILLNSNLNGRNWFLYRIWGVILPLLFLIRYIYSNYRDINEE